MCLTLSGQVQYYVSLRATDLMELMKLEFAEWEIGFPSEWKSETEIELSLNNPSNSMSISAELLCQVIAKKFNEFLQEDCFDSVACDKLQFICSDVSLSPATKRSATRYSATLKYSSETIQENSGNLLSTSLLWIVALFPLLPRI